MADKKISELTEVATAGQSDWLALVQSFETKRISVASLFGSIVNLTMTGIFKINATPTLHSSGVIGLTTYMSTLTNALVSAAAFTLPVGSNGLFKMLSVTTANGDLVVTVASGNGFSTITFNSVGDSCLLYFADSKWHIVSNNGGVII